MIGPAVLAPMLASAVLAWGMPISVRTTTPVDTSGAAYQHTLDLLAAANGQNPAKQK